MAFSLIVVLFTEPAERAKAMGVLGFVMAGGGGIGVLAGGVLTDLVGWHWIFLVNLPIGIAVTLTGLKLLPAVRVGEAGHRLDVGSAVAITASMVLAVYAIVKRRPRELLVRVPTATQRRCGGPCKTMQPVPRRHYLWLGLLKA